MLIQRGTCTTMFRAALSTIARLWKEPKCPSIDEWIKKMWYTHTMECYSVTKKNEILPFATTWIDLECIILGEITLSEKDKYHMIALMCNLRNKTSEEREKKETNQEIDS